MRDEKTTHRGVLAQYSCGFLLWWLSGKAKNRAWVSEKMDVTLWKEQAMKKTCRELQASMTAWGTALREYMQFVACQVIN